MRVNRPEGYELIKEEHNRRGKAEGRNQIKSRAGLAGEGKALSTSSFFFSLSLAKTFAKKEDKTKWGDERRIESDKES